jgi:hypothetical protein
MHSCRRTTNSSCSPSTPTRPRTRPSTKYASDFPPLSAHGRRKPTARRTIRSLATVALWNGGGNTRRAGAVQGECAVEIIEKA